MFGTIIKHAYVDPFQNIGTRENGLKKSTNGLVHDRLDYPNARRFMEKTFRRYFIRPIVVSRRVFFVLFYVNEIKCSRRITTRRSS